MWCHTVDNEVAMTQSKLWKLILLFLPPLYLHCVCYSQSVFLSLCLFLSTPHPYTHPRRLEYKAVVRHEALPSSPVCNLAQYTPSLTSPPSLRLIPLFHQIQAPRCRLSCYKKHRVIWHSGAKTGPLQLAFEKKKEKDREVGDGDSGERVRKNDMKWDKRRRGRIKW